MIFSTDFIRKMRICGLTGLILTMLALNACTPARMGLPMDFRDNAIQLDAEGRQKISFNEDFSLDGYEVTDVKRGWTTRTTIGFFSYKKMKAKQKYEFTLVNDITDDKLHAYCATNVRASELNFKTIFEIAVDWGLKSETVFITDIEEQENGERWIMALEETGTRANLLSGWFSDGTDEYRIEATQSLDGSKIKMAEATGYYFYFGDRLMAAVDILNQGSIYLHPDMNTKTKNAVCTAATSLMLYRNIMD